MKHTNTHFHTIILILLSVWCLALILFLSAILWQSKIADTRNSAGSDVVKHMNTNRNQASSGSASVLEDSADQDFEESEVEDKIQAPLVFNEMRFALFSSVFADGSVLPQRYTCDGAGEFPELSVYHIPSRTQSLVLTLHDSSMPESIRADHTWYHFLAWNIDPETQHLSATWPQSVRFGTTTSGTPTFVPPCPPDKEHAYIFTLYALDSAIELATGASAFELMSAIRGKVIATTTLTARYSRYE